MATVPSKGLKDRGKENNGRKSYQEIAEFQNALLQTMARTAYRGKKTCCSEESKRENKEDMEERKKCKELKKSNDGKKNIKHCQEENQLKSS